MAASGAGEHSAAEQIHDLRCDPAKKDAAKADRKRDNDDDLPDAPGPRNGKCVLFG